MESTATGQSNQGDFWHHRSFKIIVGYFIGGWTFLEFLGFVLQRFNISPYWSAVFLDLLLLFIPAILVLSFAPREGKRPMVLMRRYIIPTNALVAILLVSFLFWGKDLGATTKTVYYQDENGLSQPLTVQKEEFATKIIVEELVGHDSLNKEDDWLVGGVSRGAGFSLNQVKEIYFRGTDLEKPTLKEIIEELRYENFEYYVNGVLNKINDSIYVQLTITEPDGSQQQLDPIIGIDPIEIIDRINKTILLKLKVSSNNVILPFKEIGTSSAEAFKAWGSGDITGAIEKDSTFMLAWGDKLSWSLFQDADDDFLARIAETSIKHIRKLPDRLQDSFKTLYWYSLGEYGKCESSIEKQLKRNPGDQDALDQKIFLHSYMGNLEKVNEALLIKLKRNYNERNVMMALGNYSMTNEPEEMEKLISEYGDRMNPTRKVIIEALLAFYKKDYEGALKKKDEVMLLDPSIDFADKFEKIIAFNRGLSNEKKLEIYKSLEGHMIVGHGKKQSENRVMNDQLVYCIGNTPRVTMFLSDSTSYAFFDMGRMRWNDFNAITNQAGDIAYIDLVDRFRQFVITERLEAAISCFYKKDYLKADSLFKEEHATNPETFFIKNYLAAIEYQTDPNSTLLEDLEGMKLVRPNGDFVGIILRDKDCLKFEFNASINRVYPIRGNWLVNLDSRRNKYKVSYTANGIVMDRYEWNPEIKEYDKKNTYVEFRPAL